jgi:NADP-dependent aldehyde dehydrogenase
VFTIGVNQLLADPTLQDEVFGPAALVVTYDSVRQLRDCLEGLQGQLTISVHAERGDSQHVSDLLPVLEQKAGRLLMNGWPTGVEVNHAMVHGGPFPATSDSRTTSVGSLAIMRFQRPLAYQGFDDALLPAAMQEGNPMQLPRRVDGVMER